MTERATHDLGFSSQKHEVMSEPITEELEHIPYGNDQVRKDSAEEGQTVAAGYFTGPQFIGTVVAAGFGFIGVCYPLVNKSSPG